MAAKELMVIGYPDSFAQDLAAELDGWLLALPDECDDDALERWRTNAATGPSARTVIVCLMPELAASAPVVSIEAGEWQKRAETPLLRWTVALGVAALSCEDEGTIIAVTDAPTPLDAAALAPEAAIGDAVKALVRSIASSEGKRGVRANTVTTPARVVAPPVVAPEPPLAGFPGALDEDVSSMIKLLLSGDTAFLTGHCLSADRGRSW